MNLQTKWIVHIDICFDGEYCDHLPDYHLHSERHHHYKDTLLNDLCILNLPGKPVRGKLIYSVTA